MFKTILDFWIRITDISQTSFGRGMEDIVSWVIFILVGIPLMNVFGGVMGSILEGNGTIEFVSDKQEKVNLYGKDFSEMKCCAVCKHYSNGKCNSTNNDIYAPYKMICDRFNRR